MVDADAAGALLVAYGERQTASPSSFPAIWISERAAGGGWGEPEMLSSPDGFFLGEGQGEASALLADDGDAAVAWRLTSGGEGAYLYALRVGGAWSRGFFDAGLWDCEPRDAYEPAFAGAANGTFVAIYRNDDVYATMRLAGAPDWEPMATLSGAATHGTEPRVAAAAGGQALGLWIGWQRDLLVASARTAAGAWSPAAPVAAIPIDLVWHEPLLADDGTGWALWWSAGEGVSASAWLP